MKTKKIFGRWATVLFTMLMVSPAMQAQTRPEVGNGSTENPFQIGTADELLWYAQQINHAGWRRDINAELTNDIDLSSVCGNGENGSADAGWEPIGYDYGFQNATFDGKGHTISGLYSTDEVIWCAGLFGWTTENSVIKNLTVEGSIVFYEWTNGAGICTENSGSIINCHNKCNISGNGSNIGGICSSNYGLISHCSNYGEIRTESSEAGGICGGNDGTVTNCFNAGPVYAYSLAGGLIGMNHNMLSYSLNIASVYAEEDKGGLCGENCRTIVNSASLKFDENVPAVGRYDDYRNSVITKSYMCPSEELASGHVAYLLNDFVSDGTQQWYQTLTGDDADPFPTWTSNGNNTVYQKKTFTDCVNYTVEYFNEEQEDDITGVYHVLTNGICSVCDNLIGDYTLVDGENYTLQKEYAGGEEASISYIRNFSCTDWQPLYLAFSLDYDDWSDKAEVAELAGVHMYDDGRTVIEFLTVKEGSTHANLPYVIKPKETGEVAFHSSSKVLQPAIKGSISCSTPRWTYKFHGLHENMYGYLTHFQNAAYVLGEGNVFGHPSGPISSSRFYMTKEQSSNGYWQAPARPTADVIYMMVDGVICGEATGILSLENESETADYFDLQGRKTQTPQRGLFINGGKKLIIK